MPCCEEEQSANWSHDKEPWQNKRACERQREWRRRQTKACSLPLSLSKPDRGDNVEGRRCHESEREHPAERIKSVRADKRRTHESPSERGPGKLAVAGEIRERDHRAEPEAESWQGVQN